MSALFRTITGADWSRELAAARARAAGEGSAILRGIRAAVARHELARRNLSLRRDIPTAHAEGGAGLGTEPALTGARRPAADTTLTAASRSAGAGRPGDHRNQGTECAHAHAGSGDSLP